MPGFVLDRGKRCFLEFWRTVVLIHLVEIAIKWFVRSHGAIGEVPMDNLACGSLQRFVKKKMKVIRVDVSGG